MAEPGHIGSFGDLNAWLLQQVGCSFQTDGADKIRSRLASECGKFVVQLHTAHAYFALKNRWLTIAYSVNNYLREVGS